MRDYTAPIISQYRSSPILTTILSNLNQNLDPTADLTNFYNTIWNVATATGYGLDVWGRIVGVTRYLNVPNTFSFFGFNGGPGVPFGAGVFYTGGGGGATTQVTLTDDAFRTLILLKARANITNCSAQSLNVLLAGLFGAKGRCYVDDSAGGMTFVFVFKFFLSPEDFSILSQSGVLPRPAGVSYSILQGF